MLSSLSPEGEEKRRWRGGPRRLFPVTGDACSPQSLGSEVLSLSFRTLVSLECVSWALGAG